MKKIINQMEKLLAIMEHQIESREETYDSRSENWQDSEKGEDYLEVTEGLKEMELDLMDWIEELTEI